MTGGAMKMKILLACVAAAVTSWTGPAWGREDGPKGGRETASREGREIPPPGEEEGFGEERGARGDRELAGNEERDALEFVREAAPEMQDEFFRIRREKPGAFRKKLRRMGPMLKNPETREALKRQFRLEFQVRRMAAEMGKAEGASKEALKKDLTKVLSEQFDAKLELQVLRLKKMKEDLAQLDGRISKRKAQKDEIVKKRLGELSGEAESWDW